MPKTLTRYTVLLSAPGDAAHECEIADEELQKITRTHSGEIGIEFYPTDWRRDSRADSGDEPQKLLNKQIVENADIILAIFRERFGTPTSQYGSGTEEEIMLGLEMGKTVLVYFWEPENGFVLKDSAQFAKIAELKKKLQAKTVYKSFADDAKLGNLVRHDFTKLLFELEGGAVLPKPQLALMGILENGEIAQGSVPFVRSVISSRLNPAAYDGAVREAYERLRAIKLPRKQEPECRSAETGSLSLAVAFPGLSAQLSELSERSTPWASIFPSKPIEVTQASRDLVASELESLGLCMTEELFDLGGLRESERCIPTGLNSSERMLLGSDVEKRKYEALQTLIHKCELRRDFAVFLRANVDVGAISLAISNNGGVPAHHVNVDIEISAAACIQPRELVAPSDFLMAHGIDTQENCENIVNHIFGIDETVNFESYEDSCVKTESGPRIPPMLIGLPTNPLYGIRYLESADFDDLIDFKFGEYKFIPNAKEHTVLVRLSFDRLQQCRSYAFPTKILVRNAELACIRYWITADELEKTVMGELAVSKVAE